jgi:hypothetical protein
MNVGLGTALYISPGKWMLPHTIFKVYFCNPECSKTHLKRYGKLIIFRGLYPGPTQGGGGRV